MSLRILLLPSEFADDVLNAQVSLTASCEESASPRRSFTCGRQRGRRVR